MEDEARLPFCPPEVEQGAAFGGRSFDSDSSEFSLPETRDRSLAASVNPSSRLDSSGDSLGSEDTSYMHEPAASPARGSPRRQDEEQSRLQVSTNDRQERSRLG
eukprot:SAG11_NODE_13748_length_641_cov_1.428044_1_plen_103_part_10